MFDYSKNIFSSAATKEARLSNGESNYWKISEYEKEESKLSTTLYNFAEISEELPQHNSVIKNITTSGLNYLKLNASSIVTGSSTNAVAGGYSAIVSGGDFKTVGYNVAASAFVGGVLHNRPTGFTYNAINAVGSSGLAQAMIDYKQLNFRSLSLAAVSGGIAGDFTRNTSPWLGTGIRLQSEAKLNLDLQNYFQR